jgi:hypothetical protein
MDTMGIKELLLKQTAEAFCGRPEMPLMAALDHLGPQEACWRPCESAPSIEQILRHVAWAKSTYCHEGFGTPMVLEDDRIDSEGNSPDLPEEFLLDHADARPVSRRPDPHAADDVSVPGRASELNRS